jgi:four helix bundle protein
VLVLVLVLVLGRFSCLECRFCATAAALVTIEGWKEAAMSRQPTFDHEKLDVYQLAVEFARWVGEIVDGPLASCTAKSLEQLDESSRSVARNIAEGNGKRSSKDRCRYLDIARGSALECAASLDIWVARGRLDEGLARQGKAMLVRVVSMLVKLVDKLLGCPV